VPRKRHFTDAGIDCLRTLPLILHVNKTSPATERRAVTVYRKRLSTSAGPDLSIVASLSVSQPTFIKISRRVSQMASLRRQPVSLPLAR